MTTLIYMVEVEWDSKGVAILVDRKNLKDMPPTQLGHLIIISKVRCNISRGKYK